MDFFKTRIRESCQLCQSFFSIFYSRFLGNIEEAPPLEFVQVPFNHPLFIMYSSGTTGPPKCMVHSVGVSGLFKIDFITFCQVTTFFIDRLARVTCRIDN